MIQSSQVRYPAISNESVQNSGHRKTFTSWIIFSLQRMNEVHFATSI